MSTPRIEKKVKVFTQKNFLVLLGIVIISSSVLIIVNYFTIRIISTIRAYVQGENQYSKAQKDASRYLLMYIYSKDEEQWSEFIQEIEVPIGDSLAREAMMHNGSKETIRKGFLQGRNHPDDINDMIWLFRNFHSIPFMERSIRKWQEADVLVGQLFAIGQLVHQKISTSTLTLQEQQMFIEIINILTDELTEKERDFSENLGAAARSINTYLFYINFIMTLLTIGSATGFAILMIRRLKAKNQDLMAINEELDRFAYSASHDLRAPLTSMQGLLELAQQEDDLQQIGNYLQLMQKTLEKQDEFIRDIIYFSKNKRMAVVCETLSLASLIEDVIIQHQYLIEKNQIHIEKCINIDIIESDPLRLKMIFNNLISNAIKYSDPEKDHQYVRIKTYQQQKKHLIEVADNGMGIKSENLNRIFNMFFTTQNRKSGSGLGLYMVQETVKKLRGSVRVISEEGKGSTFTISIPVDHAKQA